MAKLAEAFAQLCAVVRPRPDMSEGGIAAGAARIFQTLSEHPEPVALAALDAWPRRSEWFPTEKELRDLLDELAAEAARSDAARGSLGNGRYKHPVANTERFVQHVRALRGDDYVRSWLAGGITCTFSANVVFTTGIGAERLNRELGGLAASMGVSIVADSAASAMLAEYCDRRGLKHEPKRKRST